MAENIKKASHKQDELSFFEILTNAKKYWNYLLSKWIIILIVGLSGGVLGLVASFIIKPKYTARVSFSLVEKSSGGGLADLASSFGFGGFSSNNGAFSGDNLLEIIVSRYAIEKTLLTQVEYKGKKKNLIDIYIDANELRDHWGKAKNADELLKLKYPIEQPREEFSRVQDSVLFLVYDQIMKSKSLSVVRKNKKVSIVNIDFTSVDEVFSKIFVEKLMDRTYEFYKETKTSQSRVNINMMQHTADSIKNLYESALYKGAGFSQANINRALQLAAVPRIKQENDAMLYGKVYAEVLKNLETLKLDLARETPLVQFIDIPRYPLKKERLSKVKGILLGGLLGGFLILGYLIGALYLKEKFNEFHD